MIQLKSNFEVDKIRRAGVVLRKAKLEIISLIKIGNTPLMLDNAFALFVKKQGCGLSFLNYQGYPKSICVSVNDALIHGIPNNIKFKDGDLVSVDMGVSYMGYHADSAFSISVGKYNKENDFLIKACEDAFYAGFNAIKPKARLGDVSAAIEKVINQYNLFTTKNYAGHGIGKQLHEDPFVYNFGKANTGILLKPGLVIAIEPMILQNSSEVILMPDNWTVKSSDGSKTSHYEHTIVVKNDGTGEILT